MLSTMSLNHNIFFILIKFEQQGEKTVKMSKKNE
jgi:hypothetical protein